MNKIPKYINPYTDFGFKKLFGEEGNKDLLTDFLNQILPAKHQIKTLKFKNPENLGEFIEERKAVFNIFCEGENGEKFIVEMQKAKMQYFKDRSIFYTTFPIREQAKKSAWDFKLNSIYFVAILDFLYDDKDEKIKFLRDVNLKDQDGDVFYDKLNFKFIQMPAFQKSENQLVTKFDKWCYFLKNLENFDHIPSILNEPIFGKAFKEAELAAMNAEQKLLYETSRLSYLEVQSVSDTAFLDGKKEGIVEGKMEEKEEIARNLLLANSTIEFTAQITGLSLEMIAEIKLSLQKNKENANN